MPLHMHGQRKLPEAGRQGVHRKRRPHSILHELGGADQGPRRTRAPAYLLQGGTVQSVVEH